MIFGDFPTKSSLLEFNFWEAENLLFSIFDFPGATGLGIEQTQSPRFRIFETDDMKILKEAKGAGKGPREGVAPTPLGRATRALSAFRSPFRFNFHATDSS